MTKEQEAEAFAIAAVNRWVTEETEAEATARGVTAAESAAVREHFKRFAVECFLAGYETARKRPARDC